MQAVKIFGIPQSFCIRVPKKDFSEYNYIGTTSLGSCSAVYAEFKDGSIFFGHLMSNQKTIGSKKEDTIKLEVYFKDALWVQVWYSKDDETDRFTRDEKIKKPLHPSLKYAKIVKAPGVVTGIKKETVIIDVNGKFFDDIKPEFDNKQDYMNRAVSVIGLNDPGYCILVVKVSPTVFQEILK